MVFSLKSIAFKDMQPIPSKYAMKGGNISPPLEWSGIPKGTKSFALIMDDINGPFGSLSTITHWVLYNIPNEMNFLREGVSSKDLLESGIYQGKNFTRKCKYSGPAPPIGTHTYRFRLFALDTIFEKGKIRSKYTLKKMMKGHILNKTVLNGLYGSKS